MDEPEPRRMPLSKLLFLDNPPAGMDPLVILAEIGNHACGFHKTAYPCDPPVLLSPIPGTDLYRVKDGRHRVIAAYIAGRVDIEYKLVGEDQPGR